MTQPEALRAARLPNELARRFAERAKALADATRLTIAAAQTNELCVCDTAWVCERRRTSSPTTCVRCAPPVS